MIPGPVLARFGVLGASQTVTTAISPVVILVLPGSAPTVRTS